MSNAFDVTGLSFDDADLHELSTAFEETWHQVKHHYHNGNAHIARKQLAQAFIRLSGPYGRNVELIKADALELLEKQRKVCERWRRA